MAWIKLSVFLFTVLLFLLPHKAAGQTTEFVYQGQLQNASALANGTFDFEFLLFDSLSGGMQVGVTAVRNGVAVADGIFSVNLDFGSSFQGADRFLEVRVRQSGGGALTPLLPRQRVTSAPYSVKSLAADVAGTATSATTATNALQLGFVPASEYVRTNDLRLTDERNPRAGSLNYIQNTVVRQPASDFHIGGIGRASIFEASQYNIDGNRVLKADALGNTFIGFDVGRVNANGVFNSFLGSSAGNNNTTGGSNSFFGYHAGLDNTTGSQNSFFGRDAGSSNTTGGDNAFFGTLAGLHNTTGVSNSFFGAAAGQRNTTGNQNSFFGRNAGQSNTTAIDNSFFGTNAGRDNTTGTSNSFFGSASGASNTTGGFNSFFGFAAGFTNTTGTLNSYFGEGAGFANTTGSFNAFFGSRAGRSNTTGASNSFFGQDAGTSNTTGTENSFFGRSAGRENTTGEGNSFFGRSAGLFNTTGGANSFFGFAAGAANTTGISNSFFGLSAGLNNTTGVNNSFFGRDAGAFNTFGRDNSFFGRDAGRANTTGDGNSFFGLDAGRANTTGISNSFFGISAGAGNATGASNSFFGAFAGGPGNNNTAIGHGAAIIGDISFATAIGSLATVNANNTIVLGRPAGTDSVSIPGMLRVSRLASGGVAELCRDVTFHVAACGSSLRYKSDVHPFTSGLAVVKRLRPVSFNWGANGERDVGFGAEEVARVEPLLATYNDQGEIEGVKYKQITTVLVNAVNEQQAEIQRQAERIEQQRILIESLTKLVCRTQRRERICLEARK